MSHLAPCPACNRHVDVAESACPFCAAALPASFRAQPPLIPLRGRLSRAAMMAAGATLMGVAACSSSLPAPTPAYGGPNPGTGTGGVTATGGTNGSGGMADTGGTTGAGGSTARDAGEDRSVIAIYGAPTPAYGLSLPVQTDDAAAKPDGSG